MSDRERQLGKLIVLRRVREERERQALESASRAEDDARSREELAGRRSRAAVEELERSARADDGARPPAQVLQFRGRHTLALRAALEALEVQFAASRGERISAVEAAARVRASLAQARRAREQIQERLEAARRERRRRREDAAERAQDDTPGPPWGKR